VAHLHGLLCGFRFVFSFYIVALSSRNWLCWPVPTLFIPLHAFQKHTLKQDIATP